MCTVPTRHKSSESTEQFILNILVATSSARLMNHLHMSFIICTVYVATYLSLSNTSVVKVPGMNELTRPHQILKIAYTYIFVHTLCTKKSISIYVASTIKIYTKMVCIEVTYLQNISYNLL